MKRTTLVTMILLLGASAYACSSGEKATQPGAPTEQTPAPTEPTPTAPGTTNPADPPKLTPEEAAKNPIEGIAAAKVALQADEYTDGPVWHPQLKALFFTVPLGDGATYRMNLDGMVMVLRAGKQAEGTTPIGNAVLASGDLVTADAKRIVRTPVSAQNPQPVIIATGFAVEAGLGSFDTLNDVVARKDGTLYVTDPGYFATTFQNRLFRVAPNGAVQVVEAFDDAPRPNGVALSPDEKTLYVGFTEPTAGTMPFIRRYTINADGTVGAWAKLTDVAPLDSSPDGLAVDQAGNIYVAVKGGVAVYRSDGTKIGLAPIPEKPTGLAFGGTDLKTLYVTSQGTRIWELRLNVPGIAQ